MTRLSSLAARRSKRFFGAVAIALALASPLVLTDPLQAQTAETMLIQVDQAQVLRLDEPASSIIIGNPMIADVTIHDDKMLVITGISYGSTNLIILDSEGREIVSKQLEVRLSGLSQMTVQRGGNRYSYACAPKCEPVLAIGDDKDQFDAVREAITGRIEGAMAGGQLAQ
jgi:Flp pilus assembly secretin CpaC